MDCRINSFLQLDKFPESILQLTELNVLDISHNAIDVIPEISQLRYLRILNASSNKITSLNSSVIQLPSLLEANLDNNLITTIPCRIFLAYYRFFWCDLYQDICTPLLRLSLANNCLSDLPVEISALYHLCLLHISKY